MPCADIDSASSITRAACSKRLRRNAADVQADAAELRPAVDERHRKAEIGRAERRRVAAGTRADHEQLCRDVGGRLDPPGGAAAPRPVAARPAGFSITTVSLSEGIRTVSPRAARTSAISESFETRSPFGP